MTSSSTLRSIPTEDRISNLPDSIRCHILSFLPTKHAAATTILSKKWKSVWLSLLSLDFNYKIFKNLTCFRKFVYMTMFTLRDSTLPIHSFSFKSRKSSIFKRKDLNQILKFVMQRGVENLDFGMSDSFARIKLPLCILNFKTLVVLKLTNFGLGDFDQVDLPCVKTLHLDRVYSLCNEYTVKLILGCPILEDLQTLWVWSSHRKLINVNAIPNLVKLRICDDYTPMTLVCKAKILHMEQALWIMSCTSLPMFHNLTHMKLSFHRSLCYRECRPLVGILPHFPKLRHLDIQDYPNLIDTCKCLKNSPTDVPECLSSQLKVCCFRGYKGKECEFEFAKYIINHSKVLEAMTIKSTRRAKYQMLRKLSSCTRGSTTCKLLFD